MTVPPLASPNMKIYLSSPVRQDPVNEKSIYTRDDEGY